MLFDWNFVFNNFSHGTIFFYFKNEVEKKCLRKSHFEQFFFFFTATSILQKQLKVTIFHWIVTCIEVSKFYFQKKSLYCFLFPRPFLFYLIPINFLLYSYHDNLFYSFTSNFFHCLLSCHPCSQFYFLHFILYFMFGCGHFLSFNLVCHKNINNTK